MPAITSVLMLCFEGSKPKSFESMFLIEFRPF